MLITALFLLSLTCVRPGAASQDLSGFAGRQSEGSSACTYSVAPVEYWSWDRATFTVTAPPGCVWTAVSLDPAAVFVYSGASGQGSGTVEVWANLQFGKHQSGRARIAGTDVVLHAQGELDPYLTTCRVTPPLLPVSGDGQLASIWIEGYRTQRCRWAINSTSPGVTRLSARSGEAGGALAIFNVAPNPSLQARTLAVDISGFPYRFTQNGKCNGSCSYSVGALSRSSFGSDGGLATAAFTGTGPDSYAASTANWLTTPLDFAGKTLKITASPNPPNSPARAAKVALWGTLFRVGQNAGVPRTWNGDSRSDVFLYDPTGPNAWVGLSNGVGGFDYSAFAATPGFDVVRPIGADLMLYNSSTALGYYGQSNGSGGFTFSSLFWGPGFTRTAALEPDAGRAVIYRPADGTLYIASMLGTAAPNYSYSLVSAGYTHLVAGDFDGDGDGDFVLYRAGDGLAALGRNLGGFYGFAPVEAGSGYDFVQAGDVNGDGWTDLLFYSSATGASKILLADEGGFIATVYSWSPGFTSVRLFDWNGDGRADVALYNKTNGLGYLGVADGAGGFKFGSVFWGLGMEQVDAPDLNGDGKVDVILYNAANGASYTGLSTGNAANPFVYQYAYLGNGKVVAQ